MLVEKKASMYIDQIYAEATKGKTKDAGRFIVPRRDDRSVQDGQTCIGTPPRPCRAS